jgi:nucleotide-binding universal stress UspA family protein
MTISPENLESHVPPIRVAGPIAVGVDGSDSCLVAVEWAASEATRLGHALQLVHAYPANVFEYPVTPVGHERAEAAFEVARAWLAERGFGDLVITTHAAQGAAHRVLLRVAEDAGMLVLGREHTGRMASLLSTSTAVACATNTDTPITVVPSTWGSPALDDGTVVVGVDGSDRCQSAVTHAFQVAAELGTGVLAVLALDLPAGYPQGWPAGNGRGYLVEDGHRLLAEALAPARDMYPRVLADTMVDERSAVEALAAFGPEVNRVVIGGRGHGLVTGALLGSVARTVIRRAAAPVTVVHLASSGTR